MDIDTYLKVAVEKIKSHFNPEKIILFGSYAHGHPTVNSDIDLMVVMDTEMEPYERALPIRKVLKYLGMPKDVIVRTPQEFERFRDIVGTIIYTAAHKGKVIYERR